MTTFLLVRHASHDWLGRGIAGRLPGLGLNGQGQAEAEALPGRLHEWPFTLLVSSPQQRTRETAAPLAHARGLPVQIDAAFDEIDFGLWTGRTFDALREDEPAWSRWCGQRSKAQPPGGERFADVCARATTRLRVLQQEHPDGHVAVFSHCDVIKAMVANCLGMSLDHLERLEVAPASVSVLAMGADWARVMALNIAGAVAGPHQAPRRRSA